MGRLFQQQVSGRRFGYVHDHDTYSYLGSRRQIGVTVGAEMSGAINDCGLFMKEVNVDSTHPQCELYNNWENWSPTLEAGLRNLILASFDAIGDYYWWTWKVNISRKAIPPSTMLTNNNTFFLDCPFKSWSCRNPLLVIPTRSPTRMDPSRPSSRPRQMRSSRNLRQPLRRQIREMANRRCVSATHHPRLLPRHAQMAASRHPWC